MRLFKREEGAEGGEGRRGEGNELLLLNYNLCLLCATLRGTGNAKICAQPLRPCLAFSKSEFSLRAFQLFPLKYFGKCVGSKAYLPAAEDE